MLHKAKILSLTLFISTFSIHSAYSYIHQVDNATDGQIQAIVKYGGESLISCRPDYVTINKGQTAKIRAYGCCINNGIQFKKLNGINAGSETSFFPQKTGFGLACVNTHSVVQDKDRGISAIRAVTRK